MNNEKNIVFDWETDIVFNIKFLPFHSNAICFTATINAKPIRSKFYSIGGGFVVKEEGKNAKKNIEFFKIFLYAIQKAAELLNYCNVLQKPVSEVVMENERSLRDDATIDHGITKIWNTMLECMYIECHTEGNLPGGLNLHRRAFDIHQKLKGDFPHNSQRNG